MRFLLLNQFYLPDPAPTGQYLHDLAQVLVERGHEVKVLCSRQAYDGSRTYLRSENRDGVEIVRLPASGFGRRGFVGKMTDYASFYGSLLFALLRERRRPDLILALTTPPYIGLLGKLAAKHYGCRHANWVMDLYPDVMFAHGMARRNGILFRWLQRLTGRQLRGAQAIIALGPNMAEQVARYTANASPPTVVTSLALWSDPALLSWPEPQAHLLRAERGWSAAESVFLYSGNMGLGHRFGEFLEAAQRLGAAGPRWVFCGSGKRRPDVETFAKANRTARIELLDYVPKTQLRAHLSSADVHLMSLEPAWQGLMVPSKLQASFAVGRPVLYVGGRACETAAWIRDSGGGWVVPENDLVGLLTAIDQAQDPGERRRRGDAARQYAVKHFSASTNCNHLARLLESGVPVVKMTVRNGVPIPV